jgi:simple sugar transport system ATP-binding protein
MFHGRLSTPLDAAAASREKLGLLMGGSSAAAEEAVHAAGA